MQQETSVVSLVWCDIGEVSSRLSSHGVKFLTWTEPEPKTVSFPVTCPQLTGKVLLQTSGTDGKRTH